MKEEKPMRGMLYDPQRSKYVADTPEERVRLSFVAYLLERKGYPGELVANEMVIKLGNLTRRCDTVVYDNHLRPLLVVEYKAPSVPLTQKVIDQVFRYNVTLGVPFIVITNGRRLVTFKVGYDGELTTQLAYVPSYHELLQ